MIDSTRDSENLACAAAEWAAIALRDDWISGWVEGAIFPCEMVYFLARCTTEKIQVIIESGRQDGYSTRIIAEYAKRAGIEAHSIDIEWDRARGEACRARLKDAAITLHTGDAFFLVPVLLNKIMPRRAGLLFDGPKGWSALSLAASAGSLAHVKLFAMHNLAQGYDFTNYVTRHFSGQPLFHENALTPKGAWQELLRREREFCSGAGAQRSLDQSSLGAIILDDNTRKALPSLSPSFKLYQPALVRAGWRFGAYRTSASLYNLSFGMFRSWLARQVRRSIHLG